MRKSDFKTLPNRLLKCGINPQHAHRVVGELQDHYDDLVIEAVTDGADKRTARHRAMSKLGETDEFVRQLSARRELKTWPFRHPNVATIVYPLACIAMLPAVPVLVGIAHRSAILRWSKSLLAAGLITTTTFLAMQVSILLR